MKDFFLRFRRLVKFFLETNSSLALSQTLYYPIKKKPRFTSKPKKLSLYLLKQKTKNLSFLIKKEEITFINYIKLFLSTYYNWLSLDGYYQMRAYFSLLLEVITKYHYAKFIFNLMNFGDWFFWRWWFILTNHDLRTEYLKQSYFLHHYTGNLIFMFQLGLPGYMYQEWLQNPISGRKSPVWFYLRWRWRNHWHPQWLAINARLVYRRTSLYRLRDFFLIRPSLNKLVYRQYFEKVYQARYKPFTYYYQSFQTNLNNYFIHRLTKKLNWQGHKKFQSYFEKTVFLIKHTKKQVFWLKNPRLVANLTKLYKKLTSLYKSPPTLYNYQIIYAEQYYSSPVQPYLNIVSPLSLSLDSPIDDVDFFADDLIDFEDQQDESDEQGDESLNYDYLFGLRREIEYPANYVWYDPEPATLRRLMKNPLLSYKRRRFRKHQRERRYFRRYFTEFISFNDHQPTIFDIESDVPAGDGPNVVDDEIGMHSLPNRGYGENWDGRRFFKIIDWFYLWSDNKKFTERSVERGVADRNFFWNTTQYARSVDETPRDSFKKIRQWVHQWTYTGKQRYNRYNLKRFSKYKMRREAQQRKLNRRLKYRFNNQKTKARWQILTLFNIGDQRQQKIATHHYPAEPILEKLGFQARHYQKLSNRHYLLFGQRHRQHLENEPLFLAPQVKQYSRSYYMSRWLIENLKNKSFIKSFWLSFKNTDLRNIKISGKKDKTKYHRLEIFLKFIRPFSKDENWRKKFFFNPRFYNNRPVPRRTLQPAKHYPKYNSVYNSNRLLSYELTGDAKYQNFNSFRFTSVPGIGWLWVITSLLMMDDFFYQFDFPYQFSFFNENFPVLWWFNFIQPDWFITDWLMHDFFQIDRLAPREGYQQLSYPNRFYVEGERWPGNLVTRHRLSHFNAFNRYEPIFLWQPNTSLHFLAGKGLKDWVVVMGQTKWVTYYSPIPPFIGDRFYWMSNVLTNSRSEYLVESGLEYKKWRPFLSVYGFHFQYMQSQRLELMNTWNITSYSQYLFHSPRMLYGQHPTKLSVRAEAIYQPIMKNYLATHRDLFDYFNLHFLGLDNYFNFSRRSTRFKQAYYTNQLPLWETYLNSICLQNYRLSANSIFELPPPTDYFSVIWLFFNKIINFITYMVSAGVYIFRWFFLLSPFYFLTLFKKRYLALLVYQSVQPVQIYPVQRSLSLSTVIQKYRPRSLFLDQPKKKFKRKLVDSKSRYKLWFRQADEYIDFWGSRNSKSLLYTYRFNFRKKDLHRTNLVVNFSRRQRRLTHQYRRIYQCTPYNNKSKIYSVLRPEHEYFKSMHEVYSGIHRTNSYKFYRQRPTTQFIQTAFKLRKKLLDNQFLSFKNYHKRTYQNKQQTLKEVRPSLLMASSMNILHKVYRKRTKLQLINQLANQYWLVYPKQRQSHTVDYSLIRQPHSGEMGRRSERYKRYESYENFQTYEEDPWLMLKDYEHYEQSVGDWNRDRFFRKRLILNQNNSYQLSPGDDPTNLNFKQTSLIKNKLNQSNLTIIGHPPVWLAKTIQHRYLINRYHQSVNISCQTMIPLPVSLVEEYHFFLSQVKFPGSKYFNQDLIFQHELTNDYDHVDLDDLVYGGADNNDENETELTLEEHDSLFDEYDQYNSVSSNLQVAVLNVGQPIEQKRRHLLNSYKRWRALPIEYYELQPPTELYTSDVWLSEIYFGPYSVEHPGYQQLSLTTYQIPKLYRRLSQKKSNLNISRAVSQQYLLRSQRRYGFSWIKSQRVQAQPLKPRRTRKINNLNYSQQIPIDYPVNNSWLTIDYQTESIWPIGWSTKDYLYNSFLTMVDSEQVELDWIIQDEDCLNFFDHSLSYNLGYRYTGEYLYSLLTFRPVETKLSVLDQPIIFEQGLNTHRDLIPEDLNYPCIKDYESCYLEFLCGEYFEGYSWVWFVLEDNTDFGRIASQYLEDNDEIDEWDDLSETSRSDQHLPSYLSMYSLLTAVGQTDTDTISQRLTNHHASVPYETFQRMPNVRWHKNYSLKKFHTPEEIIQYDYWWAQKFDPQKFSLYYDISRIFPRQKKKYLTHYLMANPIDQPNLVLSDRSWHEYLIKLWAITDCYYGDVYQGYTINY